jgi:uncharacterized protein YoaH (UPF0181 family)
MEALLGGFIIFVVFAAWTWGRWFERRWTELSRRLERIEEQLASGASARSAINAVHADLRDLNDRVIYLHRDVSRLADKEAKQ